MTPFKGFKQTQRSWTCVLGLSLLAAVSVAQAAPQKAAQRTFDTPQAAVQALIEAAEHNDSAALIQIFGPGGRDIVESGDLEQDRDTRAEFARAAKGKLVIDQDVLSPDRVQFTVGDESWPFPVPVVRREGQWQFDATSGRMEILARRIGRNELNAVDVCRGYAEAQMEFAAEPRDGDYVLKYAQTIASAAGKHDGLYDPDSASESLVSEAFASAILASQPNSAGKQEPYHGYYFRVLKAQGPDARGGSLDYVVNGKMIGGFALIAWPAEYGVSGIHTLIINHDGLVYEKDLGANTALQARQMTRFNPDRTWPPIVLE